MEGKISAVIRTRNDAHMLAKALPSLAAQQDVPIELVLVDRASSDQTVPLARYFGARVVELREQDASPGVAFNRGIEVSTGRFVLLMSPDSLLLGPRCLSRALVHFEDPRVGVVRLMQVSKADELENWVEEERLDWPVDYAAVVEQGPLATGCLVQRSVWEQIQFNETIDGLEDRIWAMEALRAGYFIERTDSFYLTMRKRGLLESARLMNREQLAFYRATGTLWPAPRPSVPGLLKALVRNSSEAALQTAMRELLTYCYLKTIRLQALRPSRPGSLQ